VRRVRSTWRFSFGALALFGAWSLLSHCSTASSSDPVTEPSAGGSGGSEPDLAGGAGGSSAGASGGESSPDSTDGTTCSTAVPLVVPASGTRSDVSVEGTTRDGADTRQGRIGACTGSGDGPDRYYRLDLTEFRERVRIRALVDAEFDVLLSLEQGPCEDLTGRLCDRGSAAGRASSAWTAELDPGEYLLAVDGADREDAGNFRLRVVAEPIERPCQVPMNVTCDTATPISFDLPVESLFVSAHCADLDGDPPALYYSLDLSDETETVGIVASLTRAEGFGERTATLVNPEVYAVTEGDACGELVAPSGFWNADGLRVNTAVAPGKYLLRLDEPPELASWLIVELIRPDCSGNVGDSCERAPDLDVSSGFVSVTSNTYCNTDSFHHDDCSDEPTSDRFFRVDLRDRTDRTRVRGRLLPRDLDFYAYLFFLEQDEDGGCGTALQCYDYIGDAEGWPSFDAVVEPGAYLIGVEGVTEAAAGTFTLEVEVSDFRTRSYSPCLSFDVDHCFYFYNYTLTDCCSNPFQPKCGTGFVSCGLDPAVQDCVCESDPVCCDGDEGDIERCAPVLAECGYFCPDERASVFACLDQEALRSPAGG